MERQEKEAAIAELFQVAQALLGFAGSMNEMEPYWGEQYGFAELSARAQAALNAASELL
jgi:hypothetical protein